MLAGPVTGTNGKTSSGGSRWNRRDEDKVDRSPRKSGGSGIERKKSDGVWKVGRRGDRSLKGRTERATCKARDEGGLDEWKQRSNKVGVWVSNIKTKDLSSTLESYLYTCK